MKSKQTPPHLLVDAEQALLDQVRVVLVAEPNERRRFQRLLQQHHYLGALKPVGEQRCYAAVDAQGRWVALLLFSAAARHLKHRDQWIGWTRSQRDRRLSLVVNNSRFLILPERSAPNLGSRVLRLNLDRLSDDWQARYGHRVLAVETFVDPEQFGGTVYTAIMIRLRSWPVCSLRCWPATCFMPLFCSMANSIGRARSLSKNCACNSTGPLNTACSCRSLAGEPKNRL